MTNQRIILDFDIPEGATHLERHGKNIGFFWKNIDGQWFYYGNGSNEWHALDLLTTAHIIPIEFEVLK